MIAHPFQIGEVVRLRGSALELTVAEILGPYSVVTSDNKATPVSLLEKLYVEPPSMEDMLA